MGTMASLITSLTSVYSNVHPGADQRKRYWPLCVGYSPETGEFPAQMASNTENVSIWWRHRGFIASLATSGLSSMMEQVDRIFCDFTHNFMAVTLSQEQTWLSFFMTIK